MSLNQCNFIGRVGNDPDSRYTTSGTQVVNLSLACSEKYKGEEHTEWIKIICFGKLAEIVANYVKKGSLCYFSGKMQTRVWENKDGVKMYTTEIVAREMKMLVGKGESGGKEPDETYQSSTGESVPF